MFKRTHAILIVDDEIEVLRALERVLKSSATIYTALSGEEGLEIIQKHSISLVMCDQRMPQMSGIDFFKEIHKTHPNIIRIILTAYTDVKDLIEAINEVGLYRYITKPWENHELQLMVRRALEHFELEEDNRHLMDELTKAKTHLEKTVEQRTMELHQTNKKLKNLSITDELTQIGNQRFFKQQLHAELERSFRYKHPLSLLLIDVDRFKNYNDEHGHTVGDKALIFVAKILTTNIRNTDFLARYGGEEFAIILPETHQNQAFQMAERLRKAISYKKFPFKIMKKSKKGLTVSIGLSCYSPEGGEKINLKKLLLETDKALYKAKRNGRNRVEVF